MATTRVETAITWPTSAASVTLSSNNAWSVSELVTLDATDWNGEVMLYADNAGTPATGDTVEWAVLYVLGNVDGSAGDDAVNKENGEYLTTLDTYSNSASGGIVSRSVPIRTAPKGCYLACRGPQVASRNIVCRAMLSTQRG